ncbi:lysylphosphatidylglycerol synthase transmembrane domain-containing protein [Aurantibacillus circumpalustris]|uniref:lysylphosphatidylglycerol synthase transmembrane domain-containing protein n=1 Tax=Aurantibacillus circumpalustris TaxID=3036359 RepID=UPI00295BD8AB|nr:lysylphosphatidylglycerol synthase transmembrane domain-containing protein [Aurantibacillus circumpalustris]
MAIKNTKSVIQFVVLLGIGILLIWLSLTGITPEQKVEIVVAFQTANYFWIGVSMLIALLSHFLRAYRWNYLLKPVGYKTDLLNATCHVLVGYFANYGIPRMGEVSRCTLAAKYDKVPFEVGFGTVITERIIDFILFLGIFLLTLAVQFGELIGLANKLIFDKVLEKLSVIGESPLKLIVLAAVFFFVIVGIFLIRKKFSALLKGKLGGIIKGMVEGIGSVRKMKNPLQFVILSLMIWACYFYALYFCFFALPGTAHLGHKECLTLLLFGTFGVIFSPGGLGAYPAIVGGILLVTYNIDRVSSFALPWLSWTSQFILIVVLGIISLIVLPIYNRKKDAVSPTA